MNKEEAEKELKRQADKLLLDLEKESREQRQNDELDADPLKEKLELLPSQQKVLPESSSNAEKKEGANASTSQVSEPEQKRGKYVSSDEFTAMFEVYRKEIHDLNEKHNKLEQDHYELQSDHRSKIDDNKKQIDVLVNALSIQHTKLTTAIDAKFIQISEAQHKEFKENKE